MFAGMLRKDAAVAKAGKEGKAMSTELYVCSVVKRSIKQHRCELCSGVIEKGQEHVRIFSIYSGDVAYWRVHKECQTFLDNICAKCELRNSGCECNHIA